MTGRFVKFVCAVLIGLLPAAVSAQPLSSFPAGKVEVTLIESPSGYRLLLKPLAVAGGLDFDLSAKVFALANPSRLVVDLPNVGAFEDNRFTLDDPRLAAVRLGAHQDKTRIVIDIKGNEIPEFNVTSDDGEQALVVEFTLSEAPDGPAKSPAAAETSQPEETPTPAPAAVKSAEPEATPKEPPSSFVVRNNQRIEPDPAAVEVAPEPAATALEPAPAVETGSVTVKGIFFQAPAESKVGSVVIETAGLSTYQLRPVSDELYELILANAKLAGNHLLLPQFPPDTFSGFQVLLAREHAGGIAIKIHVRKGTKLSTYLTGEQLWIKVVGE